MKIKFICSQLVFLLLVCLQIDAQSLKGVWQGFITADGLLTRALVLHVKADTNGIITGRSYIYDIKYPALAQNTTFRGELDFIGTSRDKEVTISELSILDSVRLNDSSFLCTKVLSLKLLKEGDIDLLKGVWNGAIYSKQRCLQGVLFLKRYETATLSAQPVPDFISARITRDTSARTAFLKTELANPVIINVSSRVITLGVRDYLRQDNDTVSVYYNRYPVVKNLALKNKETQYTIRLDKLARLNEIIMYAENLGRIPPNTSTLSVSDGITKQVVQIYSSLEKSAVIYLKYTPQLPD